MLFEFHISALIHSVSLAAGIVLLASLGLPRNESKRWFFLSTLTMVFFFLIIVFRSALAESAPYFLVNSTFYLSSSSVMLGPVFFCISGLTLGRSMKDYEWLIAFIPIITLLVMFLDVPTWRYEPTYGWDYRYNPFYFTIFSVSPVFPIAYTLFVMWGTYKKLRPGDRKDRLLLFMVGVVLTLCLMEGINAVMRMGLDMPPFGTTIGAAVGMAVITYSFIKPQPGGEEKAFKPVRG